MGFRAASRAQQAFSVLRISLNEGLWVSEKRSMQ
jgi:hypothetical protein